MNPYLAAPFVLAVSLLQSTLSPRLQIGAVWPDFALLVVMSWALLRRPDEALTWAFSAGLVVDLVSGGPFGGTVMALMIVTLIAGARANGALRGRTVLPIVTAFAGTLAFHGMYALAMLLAGQPVDVGDALFRVVLSSAVYNSALSLPIYGFILRIHRRIPPPPLC